MGAYLLRLNALWRISTDRSGAGAVEFALIAPFLLLLCIGGPEITLALLLSKKINHAASAAGDLVARGAQISKDEVDSMLAASRAFVNPYDPQPYAVRVTSLKIGTAGAARVAWSRSLGMERRRQGEFVQLDRGVSSGGESSSDEQGIIMVETGYSFRPLSGFLAESSYELVAVAFASSRAGSDVTCGDC